MHLHEPEDTEGPLRGGLTIAVMVGGMLVTAPSIAATTAPAVVATGAITSGITGKCLDLTGDSAVSGTPVQLWPVP